MRPVRATLGWLWAISTTALYTVLVFVPILVWALCSRHGQAPYVFGRVWSWLVLRTHRVRVKTSGLDQLEPTQSYVFISNHVSHLDSPAIALAILHPLRFVGKNSLAGVPFFGGAARRIGIIFIDRGNPDSAHRTLAHAAASLTGGVSTLFYAEGTRSPDGRLQSFKKGGVMLALQTGLPIVPLTVLGSHALLPKGGRCVRPGTIRVVIGAPMETAGLGTDARDTVLTSVRSRIQETLRAGASPVTPRAADTPLISVANRNPAG